MRVDIMTDIETLGNTTEATIFQIAAMAFDIKTGEIFANFNKIANIEKNEKLNVDGSTLKWWLNTNKELLTRLLNEGTCSSNELVCDFHDWINWMKPNEIYLWGNGILFDNKMIQYQMNSIGIEYPIFYRNDRDMRTLVELACHKLGVDEKDFKEQNKNPELVAHDAFDDVRWQIDLASKAYNILMS